MYVFLGLLYTQQDADRLIKSSKTGLQSAANNYQWALLGGLVDGGAEQVCVVNSVPMGTFPRHSKIFVEKGKISQEGSVEIRSIGYMNLPLIKQHQRKIAVYHKLKKIIKECETPITVIAYSLYEPYLKALCRLKREGVSFRYILIVPDLPGEFGIESKNPWRRFFSRHVGKSALLLSKYADGYVVLTREMLQPLHAEGKPFVVIEGICDSKAKCIAEYTRGEIPTILYTGALDKALGVDVLVKAFQKMPAGTAKLCIAGAGPYEQELKHICHGNPAVKFLGYVSKKEIDELQRKASILVNPRSAEEVYTKYSFPSKTMEYLATGVPVVMNKLPGIPEEYHEHLFFTEGSDADSLAKKLQEVLSMDESLLLAHGACAAQFIKQEKGNAQQAKKVIALEEQLKNN